MIPASIRNRNPGAQYPGASARRFGSTTYETLRSKDGVHKIATFPTTIHGAAAQFHLLDRRYAGMTIRAAITRWCGGYYADTYLEVLSQHAGVTADTVLTKEMVRDPAFAIPLAKAMARQEAGREYPMSDAEWREAHELAFSTAQAPRFDVANDVPSPKPETRRNEAIKVAAKWTAPVVAGGAAVGEVVKDGVPAVPEVASKSLEHVGAWRGLVQGLKSIAVELAALPWHWLAVAGMAAGVLVFLKARERRRGQAG